MLGILLGDTHLRMKTPIRRKEIDFLDVCLGKLRQVCEIAKEYKAPIFQAGDFFDSPDPSKELMAAVIELLRKYGCMIYAIHGQHDMAYHSERSMKRSALRVLEAAGVVKILSSEPTIVNGMSVYGANWGQKPPKPCDDNFNFLVAHDMIGDKPLYPGHILDGPSDYAQHYPGYNLILLGDYHYSFSIKVGNTWVINCGAMLRLNSSTRDLELAPKVVMFHVVDITSMQDVIKKLTIGSEDIFLKVADVEDCFDLSGDKKESNTKDFIEFVNLLKKTGKAAVNILDNLHTYFNMYNVSEDIRQVIGEAFDEVREQEQEKGESNA